MENNNNIILTNDSASHTVICLSIDNSKINHAALNRFIAELHDLELKYSIINVRGDF